MKPRPPRPRTAQRASKNWRAANQQRPPESHRNSENPGERNSDDRRSETRPNDKDNRRSAPSGREGREVQKRPTWRADKSSDSQRPWRKPSDRPADKRYGGPRFDARSSEGRPDVRGDATRPHDHGNGGKYPKPRFDSKPGGARFGGKFDKRGESRSQDQRGGGKYPKSGVEGRTQDRRFQRRPDERPTQSQKNEGAPSYPKPRTEGKVDTWRFKDRSDDQRKESSTPEQRDGSTYPKPRSDRRPRGPRFDKKPERKRPFEVTSENQRNAELRLERENRKRERKSETPQSDRSATDTAITQLGIVVDRRAAGRLRSGNPWVYRSDVVAVNGVEPGAMAPVSDDRGKPLGTALYSSASQIAMRLISHQRIESDTELLTLVRERIRAAIQYRKAVVDGTDAYRIIFSEADFLPGLIVDRYNDLLSLQVLTQAMDRPDIREAVVAELVEQFTPASIVERVDPRIRELEQLPPRESGLLYGERLATTFNMNGLAFQFDGMSGQKTGAFLDQRENYVAAERYARGEALDVFCYQGGFALHLARSCDKVTGVDSSRPALERAEQNAVANRDQFDGREIEWIEANAFDLLRDYADSGHQYDTIVLDPPAFAKSKKMLETAIRGYKELNLRALKMLRPGGVLVTCSCSYHVSAPDFMQMLGDAAADAHRALRIVETRTQAKDHPVLLSLPESQYLKCVIAVAD